MGLRILVAHPYLLIAACGDTNTYCGDLALAKQARAACRCVDMPRVLSF